MPVSWPCLGLLLLAGTAPAQSYPHPLAGSPFPGLPQVKSFRYSVETVPPAPRPDPTVRPVVHQVRERIDGPAPVDEGPRFQVQLEPPGPLRLFRLESEAALRERIRQEGRERSPPERFTFPEEAVVSRERYAGRHWPPLSMVVEPNYVCHDRLLFQQLNAERYGWDLGPIHPFLSLGTFYADVATLPYHLGTRPCLKYECSAGWCLPGDPVPLLLYPPEWSLTGLVTQGAVVAALYAIFP